jgi:hypothetical protein
VTLSGPDLYLGRSGSRESRAEYDRLIAEWLTNGRELPRPASADGTDITVNEMLSAQSRGRDRPREWLPEAGLTLGQKSLARAASECLVSTVFRDGSPQTPPTA